VKGVVGRRKLKQRGRDEEKKGREEQKYLNRSGGDAEEKIAPPPANCSGEK